MKTLTEHIAESKTLHQNVNITEKLLINKDFKGKDNDLDSFLDNYIEEHTDDFDEDYFDDIDDLVHLISYSFWKIDCNFKKGYSDAMIGMYHNIRKYENKLNDDSVLYSSREMSIKELDENSDNNLDKKFKKHGGSGYMPVSGKMFNIQYIVTDNYMVVRYDNSRLSYGKIVDAIIKF